MSKSGRRRDDEDFDDFFGKEVSEEESEEEVVVGKKGVAAGWEDAKTFTQRKKQVRSAHAKGGRMVGGYGGGGAYKGSRKMNQQANEGNRGRGAERGGGRAAATTAKEEAIFDKAIEAGSRKGHSKTRTGRSRGAEGADVEKDNRPKDKQKQQGSSYVQSDDQADFVSIDKFDNQSDESSDENGDERLISSSGVRLDPNQVKTVVKIAGRGKGAKEILTALSSVDLRTGKKVSVKTVFAREDDEAIEARRIRSREPLRRCGGSSRFSLHLPAPTVDAATTFSKDSQSKVDFGVGYGTLEGAPISPDFYAGEVLDIPIRPTWTKEMSREAVDANERRSFLAYCSKLYSEYGAARLNHFEHNLDVWRQLWRTCERSDVLILVADARHPLLHFNAGLYRYVTVHLKKPLILLLNKIDLLSLSAIRRWQEYFQIRYPDLHVVVFSSYPTALQRLILGSRGDSNEENDKKVENVDTIADISGTLATLEEAAKHLEQLGDAGKALADSRMMLAEHARQVAKLKRSPLLDPVGVDQLLESCRRIVIEHREKYARLAAAQQKVARRAVVGGGAGAGAGADYVDPNKVSFRATRLLSTEEKHKLTRLQEKKEEEVLNLQMELERLSITEARKRMNARNDTKDNSIPEEVIEDEDDSESFEGYGDEEGVVDKEALRALTMCDSEQNSQTSEEEEDSEDEDGALDDEKQREERISEMLLTSLPGKRIDPEELRKMQSEKSQRRRERKHRRALKLSGKAELAYKEVTDKITFGTIGHPNAGKSSVINALTGKKVVSVSRQPGHTKILQTLVVNETTVLCDCPGLVFPALDMPRELQVLSGIFPIPQTREPFSAVGYLAECIPLEDVLGLTPPPSDHIMPQTNLESSESKNETERNNFPWSAWSICEAYAMKRGFTMSHGRLDANRAAQTILYMVADGKIPFYFEPPKLTVEDYRNAQERDEE